MAELTEQLVAIGRVRSPWHDMHDIPVQGGPATIEIAEAYQPALECVGRASHLVVLAYLHKADRTVLKASPRKLNLEASSCGVFATRSPARPNPLSLTVVELLRCEGRVIHVDPLDLLDGTPVVDLKAYSPGWDSVFAARSVRRVSSAQLSNSLLIPFLQRDLRNHLGIHASDRLAQAAVGAMVRVIRELGVDPRDPDLRIDVNACDAATDALMAMTGASFASGRIRVVADGRPRCVRFRVGEADLTENI
jgi:tRNA-Thr(GGU) m(6)t(6)A37 methyltransferase TsaA